MVRRKRDSIRNSFGEYSENNSGSNADSSRNLSSLMSNTSEVQEDDSYSEFSGSPSAIRKQDSAGSPTARKSGRIVSDEVLKKLKKTLSERIVDDVRVFDKETSLYNISGDLENSVPIHSIESSRNTSPRKSVIEALNLGDVSSTLSVVTSGLSSLTTSPTKSFGSNSPAHLASPWDGNNLVTPRTSLKLSHSTPTRTGVTPRAGVHAVTPINTHGKFDKLQITTPPFTPKTSSSAHSASSNREENRARGPSFEFKGTPRSNAQLFPVTPRVHITSPVARGELPRSNSSSSSSSKNRGGGMTVSNIWAEEAASTGSDMVDEDVDFDFMMQSFQKRMGKTMADMQKLKNENKRLRMLLNEKDQIILNLQQKLV
jgi:hypothetical protein